MEREASVVVLVGRTGSGKSALAERLVQRVGFHLVHPSVALAAAARQYPDRDVRAAIRSRMVASRRVAMSHFKAVIEWRFHKSLRPILLDGYPRTPGTAQHFFQMLRRASVDLHLVQVFHLKCKVSTSLKRVVGRNRPGEVTKSVFRQRAQFYTMNELAMLRIMGESVEVCVIDAEKGEEAVFKEAMRALPGYMAT